MSGKSKAPKVFLFVLAAVAVLTALTCIMLGVTGNVKPAHAFWGTVGGLLTAAALFRAAGLDFDL